MIYCTLVFGIDFCELYSKQLNNFAKTNKLYVYTNHPKYFSNCNVIEYKRKEFSYYEKLNLLLSLVNDEKQRITYFDADSVNLIHNKTYILDSKSVYSYKIYENTKYTESQLRDAGLDILCDIYNEFNYEICDYLHERIISIPYTTKINKIIREVKELQPIFEAKYKKHKKWSDGNFERYSKVGCGYGEGGALSIVLKNNKFNFLPLIEKNLL